MIPVDFTTNTDAAVGRSLSFCGIEPVHLYLVHFHLQLPIGDIGTYFYYPGLKARHETVLRKIHSEKFQQVLESIPKSENIRTEILVVTTGMIEKGIVEFAEKMQADLIIIGKNKNHVIFPFLNSVTPSRIASKTGIPVLTVRSGVIGKPIQSVVVAVGRNFPDRKMAVVDALKDSFNFELNFVSVVDSQKGVTEVKNVLRSVVNHYRSRWRGKINGEIFISTNKARALLNYMKSVKADLLVVSPFTETKLNWTGTHISDEITSQSGIQVLAVRPI